MVRKDTEIEIEIENDGGGAQDKMRTIKQDEGNESYSHRDGA